MTAFRCFMVATDVGTNRKLRRLPVAERWTFVAGVLALAAQSPMRGALLVAGEQHVTPEDLALQANVTPAVARSTLASLRDLGMLERDEDGVEWVHDWEQFQPDPRKPSDLPESTRERKRAERARRRSATVTRDPGVTGRDNRVTSRREGEGEGEETPRYPPRGDAPIPARPSSKRTRDRATYAREVAEYAADLYPDASPERRHAAVLAALGQGARDEAQVRAFAEQWWHGLTPEAPSDLPPVVPSPTPARTR